MIPTKEHCVIPTKEHCVIPTKEHCVIPTKEHCVVPMKQLHHVPKSAKIIKNGMKWVAVWSFCVKIRWGAPSRPARSLWKRSRPLKRPPWGPKGPKGAQGGPRGPKGAQGGPAPPRALALRGGL